MWVGVGACAVGGRIGVVSAPEAVVGSVEVGCEAVGVGCEAVGRLAQWMREGL